MTAPGVPLGSGPGPGPGPGRRGYGDDFYRWIADRYVQLASTVGRRIAPIIAEETGGSVYAVHRWIAVARTKGFLKPAGEIEFTSAAVCTCGRYPANRGQE